MSDQYSQYGNHQYAGAQYGSSNPNSGYEYPQQGYQAQSNSYPQGGYQQQAPQYGQQGYEAQNHNNQAYQQNQHGYGSYGPPSQGGFQHGQQVPDNYGQHLQQHVQPQDRYANQYPNRGYANQDPSSQFPQQGAYNQSPYPSDPNAPQPYGQSTNQSYPSSDPAVAQEGDRGILGAAGGAFAGSMLGKKFGGHPIIGGILGAIGGSKAEDHFKQSHHGNNGGYQSGNQGGRW